MSVTREKLYEEVWAEPMTIVAARYGVSSSYLARVCERLHVPRPARSRPASSVPAPSLGAPGRFSRLEERKRFSVGKDKRRIIRAVSGALA